MTRISFWLLAVAIPSISASALDTRLLIAQSLERVAFDPRLLEGKAPFAELQKKFDSARGLALSALGGWYTGRCYYADSPTRPVAALLSVEGRADAKAHGPEFDSPEFRRITPLINQRVAAGYFDEINTKKSKEVRESLKQYQELNSYPVSSNDALVVDGLRTIDLEARQYQIRKSKKFLILRLKCSERTYCTNYRDENPTGRFLTYEEDSPVVCYYFKKVR